MSTPRRVLPLALLVTGGCGLGWEVLWHHHAILSLGAGPWAAALTLAATMGGLALGAHLAARRARPGRALHDFGVTEALAAVAALLVPCGLWLFERLDAAAYGVSPALAAIFEPLGIWAVMLVPAAAMGASWPLVTPALAAAGIDLRLAYACNVLGAALGVGALTFVLLPELGVTRAGLCLAAAEILVALWATHTAAAGAGPTPPVEEEAARPPAGRGLAFLTGAVAFTLEVAWFRSARAAYQDSTEAFATVLGGFLLALSAGATLAALLARRRPRALPVLVAAAGAAVVLATPLVDRLDLWTPTSGTALGVQARRFALLAGVIMAPVTLLGAILPWQLADQRGRAGVGQLLAANTIGCVAGALGAGYVLVPWLGASRTAWLAGLGLLGHAFATSRTRRGLALSGLAAAVALAVAIRFEGGARLRVQGPGLEVAGVHFRAEGADATVSVIETPLGVRQLVIDGFLASGEDRAGHYMAWMGHLPALATPEVRRALVICFGTGQTAHALRRHRPEALDLVDLSPAVFRAAPAFPSNEGVLADPAVRAITMDGRAFLRRTSERYDVITLEPMAPNFAGTNQLYSREFYALAKRRLTPTGVVAQWVPFHDLDPDHVAAILATFGEAFSHARLWIDPVDGTGILVGGLRAWRVREAPMPLELDHAAVTRGFVLDDAGVQLFRRFGDVITDDNQLLAYGRARLAKVRFGGPERLQRVNLTAVIRVGQATRSPEPPRGAAIIAPGGP